MPEKVRYGEVMSCPHADCYATAPFYTGKSECHKYNDCDRCWDSEIEVDNGDDKDCNIDGDNSSSEMNVEDEVSELIKDSEDEYEEEFSEEIIEELIPFNTEFEETEDSPDELLFSDEPKKEVHVAVCPVCRSLLYNDDGIMKCDKCGGSFTAEEVLDFLHSEYADDNDVVNVESVEVYSDFDEPEMETSSCIKSDETVISALANKIKLISEMPNNEGIDDLNRAFGLYMSLRSCMEEWHKPIMINKGEKYE